MFFFRATKFFTYCYSDSISEKQFFAKNCLAFFEGKYTIFSFKICKGLDFDIFQVQQSSFEVFVIEDAYLVKKATLLLKEKTESPFFKLRIIHKGKSYDWKIKKVKVSESALTFYS